jgi:ribosomal protein S26
LPEECSHQDVELLGEEKAGKGVNRYFRCKKCGAVLILSEDNVLYQVKKAEK